MKDLKGRAVTLVELSVSHYLLARALDMNGMIERDVKVVNTSDADIAATFVADPNGAGVANDRLPRRAGRDVSPGHRLKV